VAVLLSCVAFLYSLSRGAVVGLMCLLAWWALFSGRPVRNVVIVTLLVGAAIPLVPQFVFDRMETIRLSGEQEEGSARERAEVVKFGVGLTLDNPLVGVGPDNSSVVAADKGYRSDRPGVGIEMHNIWLKCSTEYGIPMLVAFVGTIASLLWRLSRRARRAKAAADRETEMLAVCLSGSIVGFVTTGTFTSKFASEYLWSIFMLAFAFLATPQASPATVPAPQEPLVTHAGESRYREA
jgi:O-antigen ligase